MKYLIGLILVLIVGKIGIRGIHKFYDGYRDVLIERKKEYCYEKLKLYTSEVETTEENKDGFFRIFKDCDIIK